MYRRIFIHVLTAGISFRLFAQEPPVANGALVTHSILPSEADSRIDKFSGGEWEHLSYFNSSAPHRKLLLVFLPGTGGKPGGPKGFCAFAANEGFHAVSLAYPDDLSMSHFHASADPDAFQKARENVIHGQPPFGELDTGEANSIENRLRSLLHYLAEHFPQEHWRQFLLEKGGDPDYRKLILAGQSQGGGHAAFMAYEHEAARVLMFGSPKDFNVHLNEPAKWYANPRATPLSRFFSFVHSLDEGHGCTYPQQLENYRAMTLLPRYPVVNVDESAPPYEHTRLLTSKLPSDFPHGAPLKNPAYKNAWRYMLEEPTE
jgi:hypothetical protein